MGISKFSGGNEAYPWLDDDLKYMLKNFEGNLTLLVAGSWLPLLVARGGCLGPPLDISGSYRPIFKIQTAFVLPQHDLHF